MKRFLILLAACGRAAAPSNVDPDACTCTPPPPMCVDAMTLRTFACEACDPIATDTACTAPEHATPRCTDACDFACDPGYDRAGDHCEPQYQVPTGTMNIAGTCTYVHRGWHLGQADECERDMSMSTGPATRAVTIEANTGGFAVTTTLRVDELTGKPYDPYTVELGPTQLTATKDTGPSCDPIYGTCITHVWTLAPHALHLTTTSLHDNDSSTPLGQCWEYHYDKLDCAFDLTW